MNRLRRRHELIAGYVLFAAGALLLYDAYERRGSGAPWPLGGLFPF